MSEPMTELCPVCSEMHLLPPKDKWSENPHDMGCVSIKAAMFYCSICGYPSPSNGNCPVEGHGPLCPDY